MFGVERVQMRKRASKGNGVPGEGAGRARDLVRGVARLGNGCVLFGIAGSMPFWARSTSVQFMHTNPLTICMKAAPSGARTITRPI